MSHYIHLPSTNPMAPRDIDLTLRFQGPSEIDLSRALLLSEQQSGLCDRE